MAHNQYYLFALPSDLLDTLVLRTVGFFQDEPITVQDDSPSSSRSSSPPPSTVLQSCSICPGHIDAAEKRAHFRSDWHRYNLKVKLLHGTPVSESELAILIKGLGPQNGAGRTDDISEDSFDAIDKLLKKIHLEIDSIHENSPPTSRPQIHRTALAWFHSSPSTQFGIYRAIFNSTLPEDYLGELVKTQTPVFGGRAWVLFMTGGGHFAGMVVQVTPQTQNKPSRQDKVNYEILKHKTFHRYTTRRKQGGSQSSNDKAKGAAKSAGATLRRYGEQALRDDIRGLLAEWSQDIERCERIWIGASASSRHIFWEYEGASLHKNDPRLRTFPFPTKRATQSELIRCLEELTQLKVTHMTEEMLKAQDDELLSPLPDRKYHRTPEPILKTMVDVHPKPSEKRHVQAAKWQRILEMIHKGRLETLKQFWGREGDLLGGINISIPSWTGESLATLLHVAAASGQAEVVQWMLAELQANPTLSLDSFSSINGETGEEGYVKPDHRSKHVPYDVASTKEVRDCFRRYAAENPSKWDWFVGAHLPSALHRDMELEREERRKERRRALKNKMKDKSKKDDSLDSGLEPEYTSGVQSRTDAQNVPGNSVTLDTEEQRKAEREKRAVAAEARIRAMRENKVRVE